MKYLSIISRFLVFLCLIFSLIGCRRLLPVLETPTVVPTTLQPMELVSGELPSFIDSNGSFPNEPGSYLVYRELFSEQAGQMKYTSMDGAVTGNLFSHALIDNWFPKPFMSTEQPTPRFIFTDYHEGEIILRNNQLRVWVVDSSGEPLYSWQLKTEPDSNAGCGKPAFSPSGHWMTLICSVLGQYYVDLVALVSGEQTIIPLASGATTVPTENWSRDESQFYMWSHTYILLCLAPGPQGGMPRHG